MPAMRLFTCFLQLLAGLALPAVPPQQSAVSAGNGSSEMEVVPFQEVWGRSYCRALERLVDIVAEYPSEVQHMFSPSCVSLLRCTGCCGDENLHCVPVETANVTMQQVEEPRSHTGLPDSRAGPASCAGAMPVALGEEGQGPPSDPRTGARAVCPPLRAQ
ncbi:placenta growth factor isoform X3 [Ursus maritimus]|uniref:Placenta growth factor isoform X3 n=1 Tax=Ursus maritimus TaxID=29073 RepID=A0A8M1GPE1_URSMA|nr:placenta growth factor isoform X3 [Ursus maritimus]